MQQKMSLALRERLSFLPEGFTFRTREQTTGVVRGFGICDYERLVVGQVHGAGFKVTDQIPGEYYADGLGDGFPQMIAAATKMAKPSEPNQKLYI